MFLGYQGEIISMVANTKEELKNIPCMEFSKIVETKDKVEFVCNSYYVGEEDIQKAKEICIRNKRNALLKTEVDPIITNPWRLSDLSEYDQNRYKEYRQYLLDYTETDGWWNTEPKTFKEYFQAKEELEKKEEAHVN